MVFDPESWWLPGAACRLFNVALEGVGGEELELAGGWGVGDLGCTGGGEEHLFGEGQGGCGRQGRSQKEVTASLIFGHAKVNHTQRMKVK